MYAENLLLYVHWKPSPLYVVSSPVQLMNCANFYDTDEFTKKLATYTVTLPPGYTTLKVSCSGIIDAGSYTTVNLNVVINGVASYTLASAYNNKCTLNEMVFDMPTGLCGTYTIQLQFYYNGYGSTDNFVTLNALCFE